MRIDFIGDQVDTTAPVVTASLAGSQNGAGEYLGRATLTLNASDSSGISRDRVLARRRQLDHATTRRSRSPRAGRYTVRYRATDRASTPNTSAVEQVAFSVVAGASCLPARSDEFNGALDTARWSFRHPTTPATGARAPSVADGSLVLPLGAFSLDLARTGPVGVLAQPLPDGDFTLVAKISAPGMDADVGGQGSTYAQAGLKLFQNNNNWIKVAHTRNADGNPPAATGTYFELSYEANGTRTLGTRSGLGTGNLPTWWMRAIRSGATVTAAYSLSDPDGAGANWVTLGAANIDTTMPAASGPRYIGVYGGNGAVSARYDYVRFTPDSAVDTAPPVSTHSVPGGGRRRRLVPHAVRRHARGRRRR